jgi:Domain of unknown function (DUF4105)
MRHPAALPLLFALLAQLPAKCLAADLRANAATALVEQARSKNLAAHPYWNALLHYRPALPRDGVAQVSEVISPEFFLAPQGRHDPSAELEATLAAMLAPAGEDADAHAQCRFVARYQWLRRSLDWSGSAPPAMACPAYRTYTRNHRIESLSLVFATGYLSNPASFFGHILLKFNTQRGSAPAELLDYSLNFGADIPPGENGVSYVLNGLLGGYQAGFTNQEFYTFNHAYAENELRDLWEYVLELKEHEVEQLVAHSWELLRHKYVYYFLRENCAYRMAELLGLVIDQPLLPSLPWSMPATVFERITAIRRDGVPLVREVRRIASRQSRFHERFRALDATAQGVAVNLVDSGLDLRDARYAALSQERKTAVIDALLDYYEYRIIVDRQDSSLQDTKHRVLVERIGLPARDAAAYGLADAGKDTAPPHQATLPFLVRLGGVHNSRLGGGTELRLRPGVFDRMASDVGRIPSSHLTFLDLRVVYRNRSVKLRSLDLLAIENPNLPRTHLPGDGGWAWKLRATLEAHDLACSACSVWKLEGGFGRAMSLTNAAVVFGIVDLVAQESHRASGWAAVIPRLGVVAAAGPYWKTHAMIGEYAYLNGSRGRGRVLRWENRFGTSRHWDARLSYEERVAREVVAAVSMYW